MKKQRSDSSLPREESVRDRCLDMIQSIENFDYFSETGPRARLNNLVKQLEPSFAKVLEVELPKVEDLYLQQALKLKSLEEMRREPIVNNDDPVMGTYAIDALHCNQERGRKKKSDDQVVEPSARTRGEKVQYLRMSLPADATDKQRMKHWNKVDKLMQDSFTKQVRDLVRQIFQNSCRQLLLDHPMFESALDRVIEIEESEKLRTQQLRNTSSLSQSSLAAGQSTSLASISALQKNEGSEAVNNVKIKIDIKSYQQHSDMLQQIRFSYESLMQENQGLRERLNKLKAQHDKETHVTKQTQFLAADRDMQVLQELSMQRHKDREGGLPDRTDLGLDDLENKIVPVEWFDALEGIDDGTRQQLNFKLACVRNHFQELLDLNLQTVEKMHNKVLLMSELAPEAYSVANLSLIEIFMACEKKEKDPCRIWKALKKAYGEEYFVGPVEQQYGQRFVQNYNALYTEVNKVQQLADNEITQMQEICKAEVSAQKKVVQQLKHELSSYRENFKDQVVAIQEGTRIAMEKDFESRESQFHQGYIKREVKLQKEIDERDKMYGPINRTVEQLKVRNAFDRLQIIRLVKKMKSASNGTLGLNEEKLDSIFGFLKGLALPMRQEMEQKYEERIEALQGYHADLCEQTRKLDYKNTTLEDQIKQMEMKIFDAGIKITQDEAQQLDVIEDLRNTVTNMKALKQENVNLDSIIDCHERENQRLMFELKKLTKGKMIKSSNVLEAELHRKVKQNEIIKKAKKATHKILGGVPAQKSTQTEIAGLKSHVLQLSEKEYKSKFCKKFANLGTQTDTIRETMGTIDSKIDEMADKISSSRQVDRNVDARSRRSHPSSVNQSSRVRQSKHSSQFNSMNFKGPAANGSRGGDYSKRKDSSQRDRTDLISCADSKRSSSLSHNNQMQLQAVVVKIDAAVSCDLIGTPFSQTKRSTTPSKNSKTVLSLKRGKPGTKHIFINRMSDSDMSDKTRRANNISKQIGTRMLSQYSGSSADLSGKQVRKDGEFGQQVLVSDGDSNDEIVDLTLGQAQHFQTSQKKKNGKIKKHKTNERDQTSKQNQLAASWRQVNQRLKDLELLEIKQKSQVKFEVDKAFAMAKYLDETNFSSRDPATSHAYISMVQMCMNKIDQLTPFMILQKLEKEKKDLKQLLKLDPKVMSQNQTSVAKLLNYVCLDNLNNQMLNIFKQAIKNTMPAVALLDELTVNASPQDDALVNSIQIVQNSRESSNERNRRHNTVENNCMTLSRKHDLLEKGQLKGQATSSTPKDMLIIRQGSQQHLKQNYFTRSMHQVGGSPCQKSASYNIQQYQRTKPLHNTSIPRKSIESIVTIKSTDMSSVAGTGTKLSSFNPLAGQSIEGNDMSGTEALIQQLISEKGGLRANIEKTFQSQNQLLASKEARNMHGQRFAKETYQSLMNSQKLQRRNCIANDLQSQQIRHLPNNYREKMRNQLQPLGGNAGRKSNLYKQMAMRTSSGSADVPKIDLKRNSIEQSEDYTPDMNAMNSSVDDLPHTMNSSRVLEPRLVTQMMQEGRRTAEIRINKSHARFESTGTKKASSKQALRQSSKNFLASHSTQQFKQLTVVSSNAKIQQNQSSYLDFVRTSKVKEDVLVEREIGENGRNKLPLGLLNTQQNPMLQEMAISFENDRNIFKVGHEPKNSSRVNTRNFAFDKKQDIATTVHLHDQKQLVTATQTLQTAQDQLIYNQRYTEQEARARQSHPPRLNAQCSEIEFAKQLDSDPASLLQLLTQPVTIALKQTNTQHQLRGDSQKKRGAMKRNQLKIKMKGSYH